MNPSDRFYHPSAPQSDARQMHINPDQPQCLVTQPQADMRAAQHLGHQGQYINQYPQPQHHPVLPSLNTSLTRTKSHQYHPYHGSFDRHYRQMPITPLSPSSSSTHSEAFYPDTAQGKSPSFCYSTPEATSPAPLAALAEVAVDEHEYMQTKAQESMPPPSAIPQPPVQKSAKAASKKPAQEKKPRKRGSRGPRSGLSAEEREKKRKEAHSTIERRRRVRTNNVLDDLERLIPNLVFNGKKPHKVVVMEAAARFIEELLGLSGNGSSDSARDAECNDDAKEDKCDN
ncbi:hypothetical protein GGI05_007486, partial [Coemansia sp. RSA 2603]